MAFLPTVPDETAFTAGASPTTPIAGVWNDALAALTSGQEGTLRITERRAAHVNLRSEAGVEQGTAAAPVRIDPTGTTTQPVSGTVTVTGPLAVTEANLDAAIGTPGSAAPAKAIEVGGTDGTNLRTLLTDTTGRQKVLLFDAAGNALVVTGGNLQTVDAADGPVTPGTAAGKSILAGGQFLTAAPTFTNGQQGALQVDASGNLKIAGSITATNPSVGTNLSTAPTSDTLIGGQFLTTPPAPTSGQMVALQADQFGNLKVALSSAMILPARTVTAATDTATINDFLIQCDATSNNIAETLPTTLSSAQTALFVVKKVDSSTHTVTITNALDGVSGIVLSGQWDCVTVMWNGSAYRLLGDTVLEGNVGIQSTARQQLSVGAGIDIYSGAANSPAVASIRGTANNLFLNPANAGSTLINFDTGAGGAGLLFGNGAGANSGASVNLAGLATFLGLALSGALTGTMGGGTAYTPVVTTNGAGGISGLTVTAASSIRVGPLIFISYQISFNVVAAAGTAIFVTTPVAAAAIGLQALACVVNDLTGAIQGNGAFISGATAQVTHNLQGGVVFPVGAVTIICSGFYRAV